ncbi:hypothetical protein BDW22DRAFT_1426300 [Trametopsis cervina]|nr:hypothetical protein BDW22DRAFT_1426300 [Trametopsis cervina]
MPIASTDIYILFQKSIEVHNTYQRWKCIVFRYFTSKCNSSANCPASTTDEVPSVRTASDPVFLKKVSQNTLDVYQRVMWNVEKRYGPVTEQFAVEGSRERRLVIVYKMGGTSKFFSALSNLYHFYSARKAILERHHDHQLVSQPPTQHQCSLIEHSIFQVMKEASLPHCLPDNPFFYATSAATASQAVQETNLYHPTEVALSFRLAPIFLPEVEHPKEPFGVFFDVLINQRQLFAENYALASTQCLKNKDIPEGGVKGTILPSRGSATRNTSTYAIINPLVPGQSPGIKEPLVDFYGKNEILFLSPGDKTANFMDWVALHARDCGAEAWWKSCTTLMYATCAL